MEINIGEWEQRFTQEMKQIITDAGLVDTGELLNSFSVNITLSEYSFNIDIQSADYFKYLDSTNNLTETLITGNVMNEFTEVYSNYVADKLLKELE